MNGRRKTLVTITMEPEQVKVVDELAEYRQSSRAQIIREAVARYLETIEKKAA